MIGEEKHGHHFDLPLFFNMSKQSLAPRGLSAECVQVSVLSCKPGAPSLARELALRPPRPLTRDAGPKTTHSVVLGPRPSKPRLLGRVRALHRRSTKA